MQHDRRRWSGEVGRRPLVRVERTKRVARAGQLQQPKPGLTTFSLESGVVARMRASLAAVVCSVQRPNAPLDQSAASRPRTGGRLTPIALGCRSHRRRVALSGASGASRWRQMIRRGRRQRWEVRGGRAKSGKRSATRRGEDGGAPELEARNAEGGAEGESAREGGKSRRGRRRAK